ncbi:MAG: hypothetical protein QOE70_2990 [Chthoniobacter sp.]|jgi:autotransporter-associated beta strand protein|nr:hypothetical protein [Chthoniobacter sp.]
MKARAFSSPEPLEARIAPASFRWISNVNGNWNVGANWFNEDTATANDGFPNSSMDTAKFINNAAVTAAAIIVSIPTNVTITVGSLQFDDATNYTINDIGSGNLVLDGPGVAIVASGSDGTFNVAAPVTFADPIALTANGTGALIFSDAISESGGPQTLSKSGSGVLRFSGSASNTYTGLTTVQAGTLELQKGGGVGGAVTAIAGPLMIGDGSLSPGPDTVKLLAASQIGNVAVTVSRSGVLDLNGVSDSFGALTLEAGTASGGQVTTGAGTLTLGGDVTLTINGTGAAGASITGNLALGTSARTFTINDGSSTTDALTLDAVISGGTGAADSLVKTGFGTLVLAGSSANTFAGTARVNNGTLQLAKAGVVAIPDALVIGDSTVGDVVIAAADNNIGSGALVQVNDTGVLNFGAFSNSIGPLTLFSGPSTGAQVVTTTGTLTLTGSLTVNANGNGAAGAFIGGKLDLGAFPRAFTVADGGSTADLDISAVISGAGVGFNKLGTGTLRLTGTAANTFSGETDVSSGVLELNKTVGIAAIPGDLKIFGGTARLLKADQIADAGAVTVGPAGTLSLNGQNETLGPLRLEFGTTGAAVTTGAGTLTLNDDVTVADVPGVGGTAMLTGNLSLGAVTRTFTVEGAGAAGGLIANAAISGGSGLTKAGSGRLQLTGSVANTYTGLVTVTDGTLELNKTAGTNATTGNIEIGDGVGAAGSASVVLKASNQISNNGRITVRTEGLLDFAGASDSLSGLTLESGDASGAQVTTGAGTLFLSPADPLDLTVNVVGAGAMGATISGKLDLNANGQIFNVADGAAAADLDISAAISGSGGIVKAGAGVLRLSGSGSNTFTAGSALTLGTLELAKTGGATAISGSALSAGTSGVSTIRLLGPDQIGNTTAVTVGVVGTLDLNGQNDTIGALTLVTNPVAGGKVTTGAGTLTLGGDVALNVSEGGGATAGISGQLDLGSATRNFTINDGAGTAPDLEISAVISGGGGLTKAGAGTLRLSGTADNTYSGFTTVNAGVLELAKTTGVDAFGGFLFAGATAGLGTVRLLAAENIPNLTSVFVTRAGLLDLNGFDEKIGALSLETGGVGGSFGAQVTTGAGTLTLGGDLNVTAGNPTPATISGKLDLGGTRFLIANTGSNALALDISATISNSSLGVLLITGSAAIRYSGSAANTFTGLTSLSGATLELAKDPGVNAIAGDVSIGGASGATLRVTMPNNIADTAAVTVDAGGLLKLEGVDETIGALTMFAGGTTSSNVITGAGTLTLGGDVKVVSSSGGSSSASISGHLDFGGGTRTFNVADTTAAFDLVTDALFSGSGGFVKAGAGVLRINNGVANTFNGPTTVNAGTLDLARGNGFPAIPGALVVNAATVLFSQPGAVADAALIALNSGATLTLVNSDTLGPLVLASASTINVNGTLTLDDTLTLAVGSPGATAPKINGSLDLAGVPVVFAVSVIPSPGDTFKVLEKVPAGPITGTFDNAAEGAKVPTPGGNFMISYQGGTDANDVVVTPLFIKPEFSNGNKTAMFTDRDGDAVTVKATAGTFDLDNFLIFAIGSAGGGQLAKLTLSDPADHFAGAGISITAQRGESGGNGFVNVGFIDATGVDLGAVSVAGDLGRINAGTPGGDAKIPALKSLTVQSLGLLGASTQAAGATPFTNLKGSLPKLTVANDIRNVDITVSDGGLLGTATVGGSIAAGVSQRFFISAEAGIGTLKVAGDIRTDSTSQPSNIFTDGPIGTISVGGSIDAPLPGQMRISAFGQLAAPDSGLDLALKTLNVRGSVRNLSVFAGATSHNNADASIDSIAVGGDWIASSVQAGTAAGPDFKVGTNDDVKLAKNTAQDRDNSLVSTIQSITINGQALGTFDDATDGLGIVAESIGKAKVGGRTFGFIGPVQHHEAFFAAPTGPGAGSGSPVFDFTIRELGGMTSNPTFTIDLDTSAGKVATYTDVDGDRVTVTTSAGTFEDGDFKIVAAPSGGGQLRLLVLDSSFEGANVTFTAQPDSDRGNGFVNIGALDTRGVSLGSISIAGDLGALLGAGSVGKVAVNSFTAHSIGALGASTLASGGVVGLGFNGGVGKLTINGDVRDARLSAPGATDRIGSVALAGSLVGSAELSAGGGIGAVKIGGSVRGGKITSGAALGAVSIAGDLIGDGASATISAFGQFPAPMTGLDVAIKSLTVKGGLEKARIEAGTGAMANADAAIGAISVGREWLASSVLAGVRAGADGLVGTSDDAKLLPAVRDVGSIFSQIASITIKGQAFGTTAGDDSFGVIAEQIGKAKIGSVTLRFTSGPRTVGDFFAVGTTNDFAIGESRTP